MFGKPSLITRIAVGKLGGFAFGLAWFLILPALLPEPDPMLRWGILLWYTTIGAIIGVFGVVNWNPVLSLSFPWWVSAPVIGGWMNFLLALLMYDTMYGYAAAVFGADSVFTSPFWVIAEGAIIGLVIGYAATRAGGEGPETAGR